MEKKTYKFLRRDIIIKKSQIPGAGNGVFATVNIPKGKFLDYYLGELICTKEFYKLKNTQYVFAIDIKTSTNTQKEYYINALDKKISNWTRYVNGAKTAKQEKNINIEAKQKGFNICYYTCKSIKKGEELIMSYGNSYW